MRLRALAVLLLGLLIAWAAPLVGLAAAGRSLAPYLAFPPRTEPIPHAAFSWPVFAMTAIPALAAVTLYLVAVARSQVTGGLSRESGARCAFPWWGWAGLVLIACGWTLAWTDVLVPPEWRRHTFIPLWLGYVIVMNALACRRSGRSLLTHRPGWLLALFPASALFWWLFEWLNQFTGNWHYTGIEARDGWDYLVQATPPFSTVLPAVASTWAWIRTHPRLEALRLPAMRGHRALAWAALVGGAAGLAGIGLWPEALYPLLWAGPVGVLAGVQHLVLGETLFSPLARGDWRPVLQPALAALVCGFFWELWNFGSLAQWHYSIPYAQRFHLFEMPLLGYAGYLPFGLECALVMDLLTRLAGPPPQGSAVTGSTPEHSPHSQRRV